MRSSTFFSFFSFSFPYVSINLLSLEVPIFDEIRLKDVFFLGATFNTILSFQRYFHLNHVFQD